MSQQMQIFEQFFETISSAHPENKKLNKHLNDFKIIMEKNDIAQVQNFLQNLEIQLDNDRKSQIPMQQERIENQAIQNNKKYPQQQNFIQSEKNIQNNNPSNISLENQFQIQSISKYAYFINNKFQLKNFNPNAKVGDFKDDGDSFYKCLVFRHLEYLCLSKNSSRVLDFLLLIKNKHVKFDEFLKQENQKQSISIFCDSLENLGKQIQTPNAVEKFHQIANQNFIKCFVAMVKELIYQFLIDRSTSKAKQDISSSEMPVILAQLRNQFDPPSPKIIKVIPFILDCEIMIHQLDAIRAQSVTGHFNSQQKQTQVIELLHFQNKIDTFAILYQEEQQNNQKTKKSLNQSKSQKLLSQRFEFLTQLDKNLNINTDKLIIDLNL